MLRKWGGYMFSKENYKMIATDLDGTLLDKESKISTYTLEVLKKLKEKGYYLTIATGRSLESVKSVIPDLSLFDYILLNNGAFLYLPQTGKGEYFGVIEEDVLKDLTANFDEQCTEINFCSAYCYYIYKATPKKNQAFIKGIKEISEIKEEDKITKINFFPKKETDLESLYQMFQTRYPNLDIMIMQESKEEKKWLVLLPKNINKKTSVERVCKELCISLKQVIAFGDATNDLLLLEAVGYSVVVSTALEEVKKVAKKILKGEEGDSIAHFLEGSLL